MQTQLAAWRARVGAQRPEPNPQFDAALHRRLYVDQDASQLSPGRSAAEMQAAWIDWRKSMNQVVAGRKPRVTSATGDIRLQAKDAIVHAETMRYEPESHKNVLGYWVNPKDWGEKTLSFTVVETGHFQQMIQMTIGEVELRAGEQMLAIKPRTKPGPAVMDVRRIVLRPK
jgi:hypothetical protein